MKKITFLLLMLSGFLGFSQQKSTGVVNFFTGLSANLVLDNSTTTATLTINGPSDRWFAVTIGSFSAPGAMTSGNDVVYYNGTTLIDARHAGQGNTPTVDAVNNWTVTSNTISGSTRIIVATRPFVAEGTDYTFNFANTGISLAGAHADSPIFATLQYHGGNRANLGNVGMTLGVDDFSLNATQIYPNPSNGDFRVKTRTGLDRITIYTQTGALVKTIEVGHQEETEVNVSGLATGVYLLELQNSSDKSWKKIIIN